MENLKGFVLGVLAALGVSYYVKNKMSYGQKLKAKGWMLKMKGEIIDKAESVKNLTADAYDELVDTIAEKYEDLKNVDQADLERFVGQVKRKWRWLSKLKGV